MLSDMIKRSLPEMTLGIRGHAALAEGLGGAIGKAFKRDNHTCHICSSRIPGFMEVDHLSGHKASKLSDIRTICQFCHNLRHPLWAGARKKIIPITAPDMSQADLNRLAWVTLAWRGTDEAPINAYRISTLVEERRLDFSKRVGCDTAEILFEAALAAPSGKMLGPKRAERVLSEVDQFLRFWPAELLADTSNLDPGSRLSTWDIGGFRVISDEVAAVIRKDQSPKFDKIQSMAKKAMEKDLSSKASAKSSLKAGSGEDSGHSSDDGGGV